MSTYHSPLNLAHRNDAVTSGRGFAHKFAKNMKSLIQLIAVFLISAHFAESQEVGEYARKAQVVSAVMGELYSYSVKIEDGVKSGKDIKLVKSDNAKWLERIIADLKTVTTVEDLVGALEQRVYAIRHSGGFFNGHPKYLPLERPLTVLKSLNTNEQQTEPAGAGQPATKPADKVPAIIQPPTSTSKDAPR